MSEPIRILVVDDHEIVREGLRTLFADETGVTVIGEAADGDQAVAHALDQAPDVVLMDLVMPGLPAVEAIRRIREARPEIQVLVLTSFAGDQQVQDALRAGAIGYLLKDVARADLVRAIHDVRQGRPALHPEAQRQLVRGVSDPRFGRESIPEPSPLDRLTSRERGVLELIARGKSNKAIASALFLSEGTVKGYVSAILAKLGVEDRTQAALVAVKHGLVRAGEL